MTITTRAIMDGKKITAITDLDISIPASDMNFVELICRGEHIELMARMAAERRKAKRSCKASTLSRKTNTSCPASR